MSPVVQPAARNSAHTATTQVSAKPDSSCQAWASYKDSFKYTQLLSARLSVPPGCQKRRPRSSGAFASRNLFARLFRRWLWRLCTARARCSLPHLGGGLNPMRRSPSLRHRVIDYLQGPLMVKPKALYAQPNNAVKRDCGGLLELWPAPRQARCCPQPRGRTVQGAQNAADPSAYKLLGLRGRQRDASQ